MSWFEDLTGIKELDYEDTRSQLRVEGEYIRSLANGRSWRIGRLETPSLAELRERSIPALSTTHGQLQVRALTADAFELHTKPELAGALVQVASQFNLLEMPNYHVTPEDGVGDYEHDRTQGPACARAAGAGTVYRNYFAPVGNRIGQTREHQIDTLTDLRAALPDGERITMRNGYALLDAKTLDSINEALLNAPPDQLDALRARLRIGLHWDLEVTAKGAPKNHSVSQAFCSALPVSYNRHNNPGLWEPIARLVLEAAYEATLLAGAINATRTGGSDRVYLTLLGGGAFGNERRWITDALRRSLGLIRDQALDVWLVCYSQVPDDLEALVAEFGCGQKS